MRHLDSVHVEGGGEAGVPAVESARVIVFAVFVMILTSGVLTVRHHELRIYRIIPMKERFEKLITNISYLSPDINLIFFVSCEV